MTIFRGVSMLVAAATLTACMAAETPPATPTPTSTPAGAGSGARAGGRIAFDISSWGKPLAKWDIAPDGTGSYSESEQIGGEFLRYRVTRRAVKAGPQGYAEIRALLAPAERYAGRELPCRLEITDQPYGRILWARENGDAAVAFNYGCRSRDTETVFPAIEMANERIKMWSREGAVIDVEEAGAPK